MATARTPSVWLLSREVDGAGGERYRQNVSVYAGSAREAVALVASEFARLARITGKAEAPYRESPAWTVEQVKLDAAKLITSSITS
jgi:hypothetical protein